jgi:hypothetical protein
MQSSPKSKAPAPLSSDAAKAPTGAGRSWIDTSRRALAQRQAIRRTFGPVAQRAISIPVLEDKLASAREAKKPFTETVDHDTTPDVANSVGEAWTGEGAKLTYYGASAWDSRMSADEARQYRPPMNKQSGQAQGQAQANYEAKIGKEGGYNFNAHVTITGLAEHPDWQKKERGEYQAPKKEKPIETSGGRDDDVGGIDLFGE